MEALEETAKVEEQEQTQEEQAVEEQIKNLAEALAVFPGAPTQEIMEGWKQEHGSVYASGTSDTEMFIWRPVTRTEFTEVSVAAVEQQLTQLAVEAEVVHRCVLWGSPLGMIAMAQKGGTITLLHEQIMVNSNFLDPRIASQIVIKL